MKKSYETPSIEVVKFQYRDQVVVASNGGVTCTQVWLGYGDDKTTGCSYTVSVQDSGF